LKNENKLIKGKEKEKDESGFLNNLINCLFLFYSEDNQHTHQRHDKHHSGSRKGI
jgi:hypothetical protein